MKNITLLPFLHNSRAHDKIDHWLRSKKYRLRMYLFLLLKYLFVGTLTQTRQRGSQDLRKGRGVGGVQ